MPNQQNLTDAEKKRRAEEKKQAVKEATKEAIKEFLNEQYIKLGRWSLHTIFALLAAATCYFILWMNGWKHAG